MKTALASVVAFAVLSSGTIPLAVQPDGALPGWMCKVFPMFCPR